MNVLEKILEEIEERIKRLKEADNMCRVNAERNRNFESMKYFQSLMFATERAESIIGDIIRSHMNDEDNNGWIPVEDGLPEEHKSMFAKLKGTHMWNNAMFEKVSDEVNVTIELEDGTRKTTTSHTLDGKWKVEKECVVNKKVIAWQPLPEPYKPKKDTSATEHVMSRFMKVE